LKTIFLVGAISTFIAFLITFALTETRKEELALESKDAMLSAGL
jgi:hypothetical protein